MNCWVAEGELWVSQEATGAPNESNIGAKWRLLYKILLWIYISLSFVPTISGLLLCISESCFAIGAGFGVLTYIAYFLKSAVWWWALVLRSSKEGMVAIGSEVGLCCSQNLDLCSTVVPQETTGEILLDNEGRRLTDELNFAGLDWESEAAVKSCYDPDAFQTKGGKMLLAWLIISAVKCV